MADYKNDYWSDVSTGYSPQANDAPQWGSYQDYNPPINYKSYQDAAPLNQYYQSQTPFQQYAYDVRRDVQDNMTRIRDTYSDLNPNLSGPVRNNYRPMQLNDNLTSESEWARINQAEREGLDSMAGVRANPQGVHTNLNASWGSYPAGRWDRQDVDWTQNDPEFQNMRQQQAKMQGASVPWANGPQLLDLLGYESADMTQPPVTLRPGNWQQSAPQLPAYQKPTYSMPDWIREWLKNRQQPTSAGASSFGARYGNRPY
jgi:hypothetical protein